MIYIFWNYPKLSMSLVRDRVLNFLRKIINLT